MQITTDLATVTAFSAGATRTKGAGLGTGDLIERALAGILLASLFPVLLALWLINKRVEGRNVPFIYAGPRIGKDGGQFMMYKIRTLVPGAEERLKGRLYDSDAGLELKMGRFLRRTRLDEIPQLWNIVRGDMAFVGPRPERPSVYEAHCREIAGYHARFSVRPGLTGPAQFMTPHGAPKKLRSRIDQAVLRRIENPLWRAGLVMLTVLAVLRNIVLEASHPARRLLRTTLGIARRDVRARREDEPRENRPEEAPSHEMDMGILDIESSRMQFVSAEILTEGEELRLVISRHDGTRRRSARCSAVVVRQERSRRGGAAPALPGLPGRAGLVRYRYQASLRPLSPRHDYLLKRHVLRETVA